MYVSTMVLSDVQHLEKALLCGEKGFVRFCVLLLQAQRTCILSRYYTAPPLLLVHVAPT